MKCSKFDKEKIYGIEHYDTCICIQYYIYTPHILGVAMKISKGSLYNDYRRLSYSNKSEWYASVLMHFDA